MSEENNRPEPLAFACPHCGGPLHISEQPGSAVACEVGHRFSVDELVLEQARTSAQATWRAVRALEERARTSRWALAEPELYRITDPDRLRDQAERDEQTARSLRRYASALDLTVGLSSRADGGLGHSGTQGVDAD
jgi:two-component system, chemotaxis family, protein-glutamate methylesterase/glutaminase